MKAKFYRLVTQLSCTEESPAEDTATALLKRYGIAEVAKDGTRTYHYDTDTALLLLTVRLDMELNDFSSVQHDDGIGVADS